MERPDFRKWVDRDRVTDCLIAGGRREAEHTDRQMTTSITEDDVRLSRAKEQVPAPFVCFSETGIFIVVYPG